MSEERKTAIDAGGVDLNEPEENIGVAKPPRSVTMARILGCIGGMAFCILGLLICFVALLLDSSEARRLSLSWMGFGVFLGGFCAYVTARIMCCGKNWVRGLFSASPVILVLSFLLPLMYLMIKDGLTMDKLINAWHDLMNVWHEVTVSNDAIWVFCTVLAVVLLYIVIPLIAVLLIWLPSSNAWFRLGKKQKLSARQTVDVIQIVGRECGEEICVLGLFVLGFSYSTMIESWMGWVGLGFALGGLLSCIFAAVMHYGKNWIRIFFTASFCAVVLCCLAGLFYWLITGHGIVSRSAGDTSSVAPIMSVVFVCLVPVLTLAVAVVLNWRQTLNSWFLSVKNQKLTARQAVDAVRTFGFVGCLGSCLLVPWFVGIPFSGAAEQELVESGEAIQGAGCPVALALGFLLLLLGGIPASVFSFLVRRGKNWARCLFTALSGFAVLYDFAVLLYFAVWVLKTHVSPGTVLCFFIGLVFVLLLTSAIILCWLPAVNAWFREIKEQKSLA